jgi:hypothetical protein
MSTIANLTTVRVAVGDAAWTLITIPAGAVSPQISIEAAHPWVVNPDNPADVTEGFYPGTGLPYAQLAGITLTANTGIYVNPNGGATNAVLIYGS